MGRLAAGLWQRGNAQVLPELREAADGRSLGQFMAQLFANLGRRQYAFTLEQLPDFHRQR